MDELPQRFAKLARGGDHRDVSSALKFIEQGMGEMLRQQPARLHRRAPTVNVLAAQIEGYRIFPQVVNIFEQGLTEFGQQVPEMILNQDGGKGVLSMSSP